MLKKFIRTLIVLVSFWGVENDVMGSAPGPSVWRDMEGKAAPSSMRRAADQLWSAVECEGEAALGAGYGVKVERPCFDCLRCWVGTWTVGLSELFISCANTDEFGKFALSRTGGMIVYEQRTKEVMNALAAFKETVNQNVKNPEAYSGDAKMANLGPWVRDHRWTGGNIGMFILGSCSRDLSGVPVSTIEFVNSHGGWLTE